MSSQVVRVQGFGKGSLGAIGKEVEREKEDLLKNRNEDIDKNRTPLNEFYKHTENGMYAEWKDTCKNLNVTNADNLKKNAIAFEGMVITSDKDYFEKLGYVPGQEPPEKVKEFFDKSYEFAKQEIGFHGTDQNILCASVHYDETTPHLQLYYVPVVDSWKEKVLQKDENGKVLKSEKGSPIQARDDKGKLVWNNVTDSEERKLSRDSFWKNKGGNTSYTQMQDRYYEQVSKEYGLDRGEKGSTKEHTTKQEWEQQKINKEIASKRKELSSLETKTERLKSELEYSKEGSVLVPQLASKQKVSEIQDQNRALKREVLILQSENGKLKDENGKLKAEQQAQADALKDHSSVARRSLDALDRQNLYEVYVKNRKDLEQAMKPFEDKISLAHSTGQEMLNHKQGYVGCLELRKTLQNEIKQTQEQKSTLESNLGQFKALYGKLQGAREELDRLTKEKEQTSSINLPKQVTLGKQIKEQTAEVKNIESTIETQYNLKGQTDNYCMDMEIKHFESQIRQCKSEINTKSEKVDRLTVDAQEHLKSYKSTQKILGAMNEPVKNIVERYDKEYLPPQEHKLALEPYNSQGLPRGQAKEKENLVFSLEKVKDIINHERANDMLAKADKPKIQSKSQDHYLSR